MELSILQGAFICYLAGLQQHIRKLNPSEEMSILHDVVFKPLKNVCDSVFKHLHAKVIGTKTKVTEVITQKEEDTLWESGVINLDTPIGLLYAVFFYNGKNFCLRGGAEHRNLKLSQVKRQVTNVGGKMEFGISTLYTAFKLLSKMP